MAAALLNCRYEQQACVDAVADFPSQALAADRQQSCSPPLGVDR